MEDIQWNHLREVLNRYAEVFIRKAQDHLQENGSIASGTLSESMVPYKVEIEDDAFRVYLEIEDYWKYVENGRGPGRYPPVDKIEKWITDKPIAPQPDNNGRIPTVKQLSFLIGRKIAEEGTTPQPFFERSKEETWEDMEETVYDAIREDIAEYVASLIGDIK